MNGDTCCATCGHKKLEHSDADDGVCCYRINCGCESFIEPTMNLAYAHEPLIQFFAYDHLPLPLQEISRPFGDLADKIVTTLPKNMERTMALRKLLEAKDCAIRASIFKGGDR